MPIEGETKREYCPVCHAETTWVWTAAQLPDSLFGLFNVLRPGSNQRRFWRCTNHTTLQGRLKAAFRPHHKSHHPNANYD